MIAVALACAAVAPAWGATYTVGATPDCSADTISEAMLLALVNPGADTIRVARDQTYANQHVVISNQSVTLIGGYDTCSDATVNPSTPTPLSGLGGSANSVVAISNSAGSTTTVELAYLQIADGEHGGVVISGNVYVVLTRTGIYNNDAVNGGGIAVDGSAGAVLTLDQWSEVGSNTATGDGGGIYCTNGGIVGIWGSVHANFATYGGGGIAVEDCTLNYFPSSFSEVRDNGALEGGGIFANGGASVNLLGDSAHPIVVDNNNTYGDHGAGMHLTDPGTSAEVLNSELTRNVAVGNGGGIYVGNGATLLMERDGPGCRRGARCSLLEGNLNNVSYGGRGGAIAVAGGGQADIRQTHFEDNSGDLGDGIAWVDGAGSALRMEGDTLFANAPGANLYHFGVDNGALLRLAYVSAAGNLAPGEKLVRVGANTRVELLSSVIGEFSYGTVLSAPGVGATLLVDCVITPETASLPPEASYVTVVTDPFTLFSANVTRGDLHLRPGSPAIDYCDTYYYTPVDTDIDTEARGQDDPSAPNSIGFYDIGADENTALFRDGFETGTTSQWSGVGP